MPPAAIRCPDHTGATWRLAASCASCRALRGRTAPYRLSGSTGAQRARARTEPVDLSARGRLLADLRDLATDPCAVELAATLTTEARLPRGAPALIAAALGLTIDRVHRIWRGERAYPAGPKIF